MWEGGNPVNKTELSNLFRIGANAQTVGSCMMPLVVAAVLVQEMLEQRSTGKRGTLVRVSIQTTDPIGASTMSVENDRIILTLSGEPALKLSVPLMEFNTNTIVALMKNAEVVKVSAQKKRNPKTPKQRDYSESWGELHKVVPVEVCQRDAQEHLVVFTMEPCPVIMVIQQKVLSVVNPEERPETRR